MSGWFISFEGPEGSGKTTQLQGLAAYLQARGLPVVITREPGGTPLGRYVRDLLLHPPGDERWTPRAEVFLFLADRAQHVTRVLRPSLAEGKIILCDRYADSTLAYQGYGRGLPLDHLRAMIDFATQGLWPHKTILLDVPPEIGLRRRRTSGAVDVLDAEALQFHARVRAGFLELARREPERWVVLDATQPWPAVQEQIRALVSRWLGLDEAPARAP